MTGSKKKPAGDSTPVAGGAGTLVPVRKHLPDSLTPGDPTTTHILRLLCLHPSLALNFRADKVADLSPRDKAALLRDLNDALGIRPFNPK